MASEESRKWVRWDDAEKAAVVNKLVELRREDPVPTLLVLFNEAQKVLPADRRRSIKAFNSVPWLMPEVKAAMQVAEKPPVAPSPPAKQVTEERQITRDEVVASLSTAEMLHILIDRLFQGARDFRKLTESLTMIGDYMLEKAVDAQPGPGAEEVVRQRLDSTPRKPKLVIVGLFPNQVKDFERDNPQYDFVFIPTERSEKSLPVNYDAVFVMTKVMSHTWTDFLRKRVPRAKLVFVNGWLGDLVKSIRHYFSPEG